MCNVVVNPLKAHKVNTADYRHPSTQGFLQPQLLPYWIDSLCPEEETQQPWSIFTSNDIKCGQIFTVGRSHRCYFVCGRCSWASGLECFSLRKCFSTAFNSTRRCRKAQVKRCTIPHKHLQQTQFFPTGWSVAGLSFPLLPFPPASILAHEKRLPHVHPHSFPRSTRLCVHAHQAHMLIHGPLPSLRTHSL